MTEEDKQLLLVDLCARLPYGIKFPYHMDEDSNHRECDCVATMDMISEDTVEFTYDENGSIRDWSCSIREVKPYLRPMSSMTEDEKEELLQTIFEDASDKFYIDEEGIIDGKPTDFMKDGLNGVLFCPRNVDLYTKFIHSHHLDFRGLIPKGLALPAKEGMYKTN